MTHPFSLAFLTVADVDPVTAVQTAALAGYDMVGLRFLPASPTESAYPILTDPELQRSVAQALADTGVQLADIEIARLKPDTHIPDFDGFLALGQRLGARHILVAGDDPDRNRLIDTYGQFCVAAARHSMTADIEPMPWTMIKNLADAVQITEAVAQDNSGILIDALHWDRAGDTEQGIRSLNPVRLHYAQVCDGPKPFDATDAGMIRIAREARLLPGEGGIDLAALVQALPAGLPISVEIPNHARARTQTPLERARAALVASKALLVNET